jgi:hypothetical protein
MRKVAVALLLAAIPMTGAQAQSMPVATFLAKADALQKKGAMALFSGDIGKLKAEVQNSGKALRAEEEAARKVGRAPATCMPPKAAVNSEELLAHFRSIPPAQRGMPVKTAFAGLVAKKYPCPRT